MTNADRIRNMDDKELAEYIANEKLSVFATVAEGFKVDGFGSVLDKYSDDITNEILKWLQEDSKNVR